MKKDVKSLISEAFEELFQEFLKEEGPIKLRTTTIKDEDVDNYIKNAIERGRAIPYAYDGQDKKSEANFLKIITKLVDIYRETRNPKIKTAIQTSMFPQNGSKMYNQLSFSTGINKNNKDFEDAVSSAYEQVMINNFDKIVDDYSKATNPGAIFVYDMSRKIKNYLQGYRGAGDGGSKFDAIGGQDNYTSLDDPISDDGKTIGDKVLKGITGLKSTEELGLEKEKSILKMQDILKDTIAWLDNTFDENGDEIGKRRMIAFKGILGGESTEEIFEDNPGIFKEPRYVSIEFERLVNSSEAKEISDLISKTYGINFNLSNIDPKKMKQTSAMNPEFGGFSKIEKISTPEMQNAQKELNSALGRVGLKSSDFNSERKKEEVINKLTSAGKTDELGEILDADDNLTKAAEKAKAAGEYDVKKSLLPSTPEEEKEAGLFEGIDVNKLMDRVIARISKK